MKGPAGLLLRRVERYGRPVTLEEVASQEPVLLPAFAESLCAMLVDAGLVSVDDAGLIRVVGATLPSEADPSVVEGERCVASVPGPSEASEGREGSSGVSADVAALKAQVEALLAENARLAASVSGDSGADVAEFAGELGREEVNGSLLVCVRETFKARDGSMVETVAVRRVLASGKLGKTAIRSHTPATIGREGWFEEQEAALRLLRGAVDVVSVG